MSHSAMVLRLRGVQQYTARLVNRIVAHNVTQCNALRLRGVQQYTARLVNRIVVHNVTQYNGAQTEGCTAIHGQAR